MKVLVFLLFVLFGSILTAWGSNRKYKGAYILGMIIGVLIIAGIIWLWKLAERWWDQYWGSFRCKKCKKLYDDRWQTEWGICWYCKNQPKKRVEVNFKKDGELPKGWIKLFTCPECKQVFKVDMRDEKSRKCKLCAESTNNE